MLHYPSILRRNLSSYQIWSNQVLSRDKRLHFKTHEYRECRSYGYSTHLYLLLCPRKLLHSCYSISNLFRFQITGYDNIDVFLIMFQTLNHWYKETTLSYCQTKGTIDQEVESNVLRSLNYKQNNIDVALLEPKHFSSGPLLIHS